jgi:hypothetical protein
MAADMNERVSNGPTNCDIMKRLSLNEDTTSESGLDQTAQEEFLNHRTKLWPRL